MQCRLGQYDKARQNARIMLETAVGVGQQTGVLRALTVLVEIDSASGQSASNSSEDWMNN